MYLRWQTNFNVIEIHGEKDFLLLWDIRLNVKLKNLELIKKEILKKGFFNYVRQSSKPWSGKRILFIGIQNINNIK